MVQPRVPPVPRAWVVYRVGAGYPQAGTHVVCTQAEWAAIERAVPGRHRLVMGLIPTEGLAEQLARSAQEPPADPRPRPIHAILRDRAAR